MRYRLPGVYSAMTAPIISYSGENTRNDQSNYTGLRLKRQDELQTYLNSLQMKAFGKKVLLWK